MPGSVVDACSPIWVAGHRSIGYQSWNVRSTWRHLTRRGCQCSSWSPARVDLSSVTGAISPRAPMNCRVPILMYHSVADDGPAELAPYRISCAAFQQHMRFLRSRHYYTISLDEWASSIFVRRPIPGRPVILTFDDAYQDFFRNACPVLASQDLRATIFPVPGRVGSVVDSAH